MLTSNANARASEPSGSAGGSPDDPRLLERAMRRLLALGGVQPASHRLTVDGRRLHYLEWGRGRPLILLQGAGGGAANWYRIAGALAERRRVLALDMPGFGFSEAIDPEPPLGASLARLVRGWLHALDITDCDIVGTSFGGLVALRLAQRPDAPIRRLVLMDSVGLGRELPWLVRLGTLPVLGAIALRPSRGGTRWLYRTLLTTHRDELGPEHERALVEYLWRSAAAGDPALFVRAFRRFAGLLGQREVLDAEDLGALELPTLVLWGADDRFLPVEHARRAAALLPRGRLEVLSDAGHSPNWEAPRAVIRAIGEFVDERD